TPGPSVRASSEPSWSALGALTPSLRAELAALHTDTYDGKRGSWGFGHKYIDAESLEYALARARGGDRAPRRWARPTLAAGLALVDPAWGGVYQYSTGGNWKEPHLEKIVSMQASNLRGYALGWRLFRDARFLDTARSIRGYLNAFLRSPDGAYY